MRKSNQEIKDPQIIEEILQSGIICRMAMVDGEHPYLLPFNYGYKDRCIYIHSAPEGRKIDVLNANPFVCFEVEGTVRITEGENACAWSTLYRSVVGYGEVEILTGADEKQQGLEIIMSQHGAPHLVEFNPGNMNRMIILKLTITSVTGKQSGNWNKTSP